MQKTAKIVDIRRLNAAKAAAVLGILVRKKAGFKLSEEERQELEFFDCLRLINGFITQQDQATITIAFRGFYTTPIQLRTGSQSSDVAVFKQILGWEEYKSVVEAYKNHFEADAATIIDAGGNVGLTSLYFSAHFPNASIVSIEPDVDNFNLLVANLCQLNVTCILGAVWSHNCQLMIVNDFRDQLSWSRRVEEAEKKTTNAVQAYSIMHIKEQNNFACVDILKIDVEGAEKELFAASDLSFLAHTKCIALEIHDEFNCRSNIYQCLSKYGFDFANAGELTIGINRNFLPR